MEQILFTDNSTKRVLIFDVMRSSDKFYRNIVKRRMVFGIWFTSYETDRRPAFHTFGSQ